MSTKTPPRPVVRGSAAVHFRREIEAAQAEGVAPDDLTLKLTLRDTAELKRDPQVAVADISFSGGVMRYLGVKVEQGGVPASVLQRGEA
jgi:hypothetical protein